MEREWERTAGSQKCVEILELVKVSRAHTLRSTFGDESRRPHRYRCRRRLDSLQT